MMLCFAGLLVTMEAGDDVAAAGAAVLVERINLLIGLMTLIFVLLCLLLTICTIL